MLSVAKLSAGQERYYLEEAGERVDVATSVASGIEDYYLDPAEARGEWVGAAGRALGLEGHVSDEQLRALMAGALPLSGASLRAGSSPVRVAGYDLTFSAPKSVSVLFGTGDPEVREVVRSAHDAAVGEALSYLENTAAAVRRGKGGVLVESVEGFVGASFRHRSSRAGDPQLHTHVVVANVGCGSDGRWTALDGRRIYREATTASYVYQAVLRSELARTLGVGWTPVVRGIAEIDGVPHDLQRAFSRRRIEIEASSDPGTYPGHTPSRSLVEASQ